MSKQIEVSKETWDKIKDIVEKDKKKDRVATTIYDIDGEVLYESEKETLKEATEEANLRGTDLEGADLEGANLGGANLRVADLRGADLEGANLRGADLGGANLRGANLRGTNLEGADLGVAKFLGKGGKCILNKDQVEDFLVALGFIIKEN